MTTKGGAATRHETGSPVLLAFCLLLVLAIVILAGIAISQVIRAINNRGRIFSA